MEVHVPPLLSVQLRDENEPWLGGYSETNTDPVGVLLAASRSVTVTVHVVWNEPPEATTPEAGLHARSVWVRSLLLAVFAVGVGVGWGSGVDVGKGVTILSGSKSATFSFTSTDPGECAG